MPKAPKNAPRCQDDGIVGTVTGIAGIIIVMNLLKIVVGISSDLKNQSANY